MPAMVDGQRVPSFAASLANVDWPSRRIVPGRLFDRCSSSIPNYSAARSLSGRSIPRSARRQGRHHWRRRSDSLQTTYSSSRATAVGTASIVQMLGAETLKSGQAAGPRLATCFSACAGSCNLCRSRGRARDSAAGRFSAGGSPRSADRTDLPGEPPDLRRRHARHVRHPDDELRRAWLEALSRARLRQPDLQPAQSQALRAHTATAASRRSLPRGF